MKKADSPAPIIELADNLEEPMPNGALRRFGSTRFRFPSGCAHATMSPDGKRVAIGGHGLVIVYDTETGKAVHTFSKCGMTNVAGRLPAMAFSPDGKLLAHLVRGEFMPGNLLGYGLGQYGGVVARVWEVESGKEIASVKGFGPMFDKRLGGIQAGTGMGNTRNLEWDNFTGLYFTDDSKRMTLVGERQIQICDARTGAPVAKYDVPTIEVERKPARATMITFSPDGKFYVGNRGAEWQVGELATKKILFHTSVKPPVKKERYWQQPFAAISPDGKLVAIPTENLDAVGLWDVPGKRLVRTLVNKAPKIRLLDHLSFSADGKQVFAGGDNIVYRWDVATGAALPSLESSPTSGPPRTYADRDAIYNIRLRHTALINAPPRTFTDHDCTSLVTVDNDGMIRRWDPSTGKQLEAPHGYGAYTIADLSADGAHVVVADGGRIDLWTLADNQHYQLHPPGSPLTRDVRFSRSGKLLAAGFSDGTIRIWDAATRKEIKSFQANPKGESSGVEGVEWSPDESCLYATTDLNGVLAWDWRNDKLRWRANTPDPRQVRTSMDGKLVAVLLSINREILILKARTGTVQTTVHLRIEKNRHMAQHCMVFSPDGRTLLAGEYVGVVQLWDTTTGKARAMLYSDVHNEITPDDDVIWGIDVSRDGRHVVTGSANGTLRVWELDTQKEVLRRAEPRSSSLRVTFSGDSRTVLSAQQRTPLLWSVVPKPTGDREHQWSDLASNPAAAYRAQWGLAESEGIAQFLRKKIGARVPASEAIRIVQLIADLDADSFRSRETAQNELLRLGRLPEPAVRKALAKSTSAEQRRRLRSLIALYDKGLSADELRLRRAIQALTWSHDPNTKKLLADWASGLKGAPLTQSAKRALSTME